ncbi:acyltransferase [Salipiger pacificus]|uniref:Acyltransferase n=2 Tax=Salipiger mangrovisoli TaxID=2865933 RepID=A0ABR9XAI1_9RHOB|nr:acyltransferase [Salipiger mangrovisoli]
MDGNAAQVADGVHKVRRSRGRRLLRLLGSACDPRAWAHLVKIVNFYNYTHLQELRKARLAPGVNISPTASFANGQNIEIGPRVTLGAHCQIWAGPGRARVVIGADALFAPDVMVTASGYRYNDGAPVTAQAMDEADVVIGADCWIGRGAILLAGSRLGRGVVVGAHSVVRGEFPAYSVIAGSPARIVSERLVPECGRAEWDATRPV